jgi:hypothetical protein
VLEPTSATSVQNPSIAEIRIIALSGVHDLPPGRYLASGTASWAVSLYRFKGEKIMRKTIIAIATILTVFMAGCASERRFMPTGSVTSPSAEGQWTQEQERQNHAWPVPSPMDDRGE